MNNFKEIKANDIKENIFNTIGHDWMLVTAGNKEKSNTMTVSWGTMGILFNKPVVTIFIRPQRYTFGFLEKENTFTLSILPEEYRKALNICGKLSGRDCDKLQEAGIHSLGLESGNIGIDEARMIVECRKIYSDFLTEEKFSDKNISPAFFKDKDYHKAYIAEITRIWIK